MSGAVVDIKETNDVIIGRSRVIWLVFYMFLSGSPLFHIYVLKSIIEIHD